MNNDVFLRRVACLLGFVAAAASACASAEEPHRVAYSDTIRQADRTPFLVKGTIEFNKVLLNTTLDAAFSAALAKTSVAQTTALMWNGTVQPVILRRSLPAGDGGATGETDMLFSIQPCRQVEQNTQGDNTLSCRDEHAAAPTFVFGKIVLARGQRVIVTFPEGITWTYAIDEPDAR